MGVSVVTELACHEDDNGVKIRIFRIQVGHVSIELCSLGASVLRLLLPSTDKANDAGDNVVLGYESVCEMYESNNQAYFGVVPGRVANRIKLGRFQTEVDGKVYQTDINNDPNSLHGGFHGFSTQLWESEIINQASKNETASESSVRFSLTSPDGDGGYPGTVRTLVTYSLRPTPSCGAVRLVVDMESLLLDDIPSPVNLTQHSYFNLEGKNAKDGILDHCLRLYSDAYTPVDETSIPTREICTLSDDHVMDWRCERTLREALLAYGVEKSNLRHEQVVNDLQNRNSKLSSTPYGFDHNYIVRQAAEESNALNLVAVLRCPKSQRRVTVRSTAPGLQLYTANYLNGEVPEGAGCGSYRWQGLCLETQAFPDSILVDPVEFPEFAKGQCQILTAEHPRFHEALEYTFEFDLLNDTLGGIVQTGLHGTDSDGNHFYSVDDMWEEQGVTKENSTSWYERAACYYKENCSSTLDGVLGGFASITETDLAGSLSFLKELELVRPSIRTWTNGSKLQKKQTKLLACECGAGIGRVTKGLLLNLQGIDGCDLIESSSTLLSSAPEHLGDVLASRCRFFCAGLQEWEPQPNTYSIVWIQWVLSYLTDEDIVKFLRRCGQSLCEDGVIVLKENTTAENDFEVDNDDASVTRSLHYWKSLIYRAGLRIIHEKRQDSLPDDIYPVPMLALEACDLLF